MRGIVLTLAVLLQGTVSFAEEQAPASASPSEAAEATEAAPLSPEYLQSIEFSIERGKEIARRDAASWIATDALLAEAGKKPKKLGIIGWVTLPSNDAPDQYEVTFISGDMSDLRAAARYTFKDGQVSGNGLIRNPKDRPVLDEVAASNFRIQKISAERLQEVSRCSVRMNIVIFDTVDGHDVYFLTPQTDPSLVQIGGHFRVSVKNGLAEPAHAFTTSCIAVPAPEPERGQSVAAVFVTDVISPAPNEIHVFKSIEHQVPIAVMTVSNQNLWMVAGDKIEFIKTVEQPG